MDDRARKKKPRGKPTFKDPERARAAARRRWDAARAEATPAVDSEIKRRCDESWEKQRLEGREVLRRKLAEQGEPPLLPTPANSRPAGPSALGDLKNISGTAIEPAQEVQAPEPPLDPEQDDRAAREALRARLIDEELDRQRDIAKQRAAGRREDATRGPAGPVRPGTKQATNYLVADTIKPEVFKKPVVAPGTVPGRCQDPPPAPAAAPSGGMLPVIVSTCSACQARTRALTLTGIEAREREHIKLSAPCKLWSNERDRDQVWVRSVEQITADERVQLERVEPVPPPPAPAPVRPRRGRVAEWVPNLRRSAGVDEHGDSEFPSSTVSSREDFFREPDS